MSAIDFPVPFKLDRSRQAAVQVLDHLRAMIISLALKPGTLLPRAELADYFALSLTPIRDALMRLEEEGLVDIFPQHATVVRRIDVASARRAHFMRLSMELEIVHTLATSDRPQMLAELAAFIAQQRHALASGDADGFVLADQLFHRTLYQAAGVDGLFELMRRQSGDLDRLRRLHMPVYGKAQSVIADHQAILDALAARDPALAQQRVRQHLSGTLAYLDEIRLKHPDYLLDSGEQS